MSFVVFFNQRLVPETLVEISIFNIFSHQKAKKMQKATNLKQNFAKKKINFAPKSWLSVLFPDKNVFCWILRQISCLKKLCLIAQKMLKMKILTSFWSALHPKAGWNIQQSFSPHKFTLNPGYGGGSHVWSQPSDTDSGDKSSNDISKSQENCWVEYSLSGTGSIKCHTLINL